MTDRAKLDDLQKILMAPNVDSVWAEALPFFLETGDHRYTFVHAPFSDFLQIFTNKDLWISEEWVSSVRSLDCEFKKTFDMIMSGPYIWGQNKQICSMKLTQGEASFRKRVVSAGYINNLTIPLWGATPSHQSLLSILTNLEETSFNAYLTKNFTFFYALAHIIHARIVTLLADEQGKEKIRLSPRERDCLRCLSVGLRNNRIAQHLGISESTIEFHTVNARKKLSARTREEAISKALKLGLLVPEGVSLLEKPTGKEKPS